MTAFRRVATWFARLIDDMLPMSPTEREARSRTSYDDTTAARARRERLKIEMLEKRGKGGYR